MKKVIIITIGIMFGVNTFAQEDIEILKLKQEALSHVENGVYLKDFVVRHKAKTEEENKQVSKFSMVLKDSTIYAFSFASSLKYPGKLVFELYDNHKQLLGKNYIESNDRYFNNFSFKCMKTGIYHMHIYFKDGKEGVGVGVLSFVRKIQDKSCESQ